MVRGHAEGPFSTADLPGPKHLHKLAQCENRPMVPSRDLESKFRSTKAGFLKANSVSQLPGRLDENADAAANTALTSMPAFLNYPELRENNNHWNQGNSRRAQMAMLRYVIERDIPEVGTFERDQLRAAAAKSNEVLAELAPDIQWVESYVAENKTFCIYLAKSEDVIREHAEISGFPATKITPISKMIDPTTARAD